MASLRFLAQASRSIETLVAHSPKARTPKTPTSPFSAFAPAESCKPRGPCTQLLPRGEVPAEGDAAGARRIQLAHFVECHSRIEATGREPNQPRQPVQSNGSMQADAARTRVAVLERQARQADRCGPLPRDATMGPTLPSLLAMSQMACLNPSVPIAPMAANRNHCASQAVSSYHRQQERRSSRDMVDFVI
eukprot:CAMPEP_0181411770 /NCGR_PEP_ID=MMETSP1110-20121109/8062_1 /TAXON_ID=174948 /ORGANISM="Symbiodinium sp., Strain CCMP421" /LENGTH=190 /DNA_ID=CAMNT_0023534431 /DNA_START=53 /DNA_END=626 /DNA_ORIENTATION=-